MSPHVVAHVSDIPPGSRKVVSVKGRPVVVFNLGASDDGDEGDDFVALADRCPHEGAALSGGVLCGLVSSTEPGRYEVTRRGEILRCPWHGWEYDVRTGQSWCDPRRIRVKHYEAHAERGEALVKGPYVAETLTVRVEDAYVVVEA